MNQETNGSTESKKPEIVLRMEEVMKILDEYETSKGLKQGLVPNNVDKYLNLEEADLNKLTAEECGNAAYMLDRMSYYIQRELNKEQARISWCNATIDKLILKKLSNYSAFKDEDKIKQAIQDDGVATKVDAIRNYAKQRMDRLSYLPARISSMAGKLDSLQLSKRRQRYES